MPSDWSRIEGWLNFRDLKTIQQDGNDIWKKKNPEIPKLRDYKVAPKDSFWNNFPKCELPKRVTTDVKCSVLEKRVLKVSKRLTKAQLQRAKRCITNLKQGASSCQKKPALQAVYTKNAQSAFQYGEEVTDAL